MYEGLVEAADLFGLKELKEIELVPALFNIEKTDLNESLTIPKMEIGSSIKIIHCNSILIHIFLYLI